MTDKPFEFPDDWEPTDEQVAALALEKSVHGDESEEQRARRLLRENVSDAVVGIIHEAKHGENSRIRFDAQKYIVERVLGRVGDDAYDDDKSPITSLIEDVTEYVREASETT